MKSKRRKKKAIEKNRRYLCVAQIRYVRMPDADERLARATDILLSSAARDAAAPAESLMGKREKPPRQAPGENCHDLAKLLEQRQNKPEHLSAPREWLE